MIQSSYLLEEMYLHDLHSVHQELSNHVRNPCTSEDLKILHHPTFSPPLSKKVAEHRLFPVDIVPYLGIYHKYKHISSNSDTVSLVSLSLLTFYGEMCRRKFSSYLITMQFYDMLLFCKT